MHIPLTSSSHVLRLICAAWFALLFCRDASAQVPPANADATTTSKRQLEALLEKTCAEYGVPGMWAGWYSVKDGSLGESSYVACTGKRRFGEAVELKEDDLVHLGSCTKAMTAVLIAQLISQDKLDWDTTLAEVFAKDDFVVESPEWSKVTVSELLEHRSGSPANASWMLLEKEYESDVVGARHAVLRWLTQKKRPTKLGFLYSNVGYCLLGHIVEQIEGESWEVLVSKRLFEPLGMETAGTGPVLPKGVNANQPLSQPWGHVLDNGANLLQQVGDFISGSTNAPKWKPARFDNAVPLGPAGRAHMSLADWAKFVALFVDLEEPDPRLNIDVDVWQRLVQPQAKGGDYAGGWILGERGWAGGRILNHAGTNTTWFCIAWVAPKKDFFTLVACNAYSAQVPAACDKISGALVTSKGGRLAP